MGRHSAVKSGEARALEGARVLVTRSPDRAAPLVNALRGAGAEPLLLPLIDFERARDQHSLEVALDALRAGAYGWLVVSSITTVRALKEKAAERRLDLRGIIPESVRVATIGPSSRRVLEAEGIPVDLAPDDVQSAAGLVSVWPAGPASVFLPQADIADDVLAAGIEAKGAVVQAVTAYHTVDYPAVAERRLTATLAAANGWQPGDGSGAPQLTPEAARAELARGRLHAVVAASPSAARRIQASLAPLEDCRFIAIGRSTAAEAAALGLPVAATAKEPTPAGIVAALRTVFATEGNES
ncbi:uroporphyrinogen-III synthase [Arthrobacter bambusae]|uniref:uroporphyrinogen-III synthase n=1 Tax=Arthrobacter bambusae TaxID=1338426 RepID=UPI00277DD8C4|nr:uroporphyrinogen-III synthase [Arthrobacter bambusae]MDQ0030273.1 uroporphyrinogen-III synthase [Arthrobacter bambusae]MDQ0097955.1 uroporphyrinogen-III synthase [Arthrobacter bambusae]